MRDIINSGKGISRAIICVIVVNPCRSCTADMALLHMVGALKDNHWSLSKILLVTTIDLLRLAFLAFVVSAVGLFLGASRDWTPVGRAMWRLAAARLSLITLLVYCIFLYDAYVTYKPDWLDWLG